MSEDTLIAEPALARGEALAGKLAGYRGPSWRKAYLARLLQSGRDLLAAGQARSGAYCLDKVEAELAKDAGSAAPSNTAASASPGTAGPGLEAAGGAQDPAASPRPALDQVRSRWREARVRDAESVLRRHGARLSSLERRIYRETLEKWSKSAQAAPAVSGPTRAAVEHRADMALLELRRRLYGRILKAQKSVLARRAGGGLALVRVHEQFPGPIGPYNDRQNLEGVLTALSQADAAWVEDFLAHYRRLDGLRALLPSLKPGAAKR